jgi:hypothetical protein
MSAGMRMATDRDRDNNRRTAGVTWRPPQSNAGPLAIGEFDAGILEHGRTACQVIEPHADERAGGAALRGGHNHLLICLDMKAQSLSTTATASGMAATTE